jgi:hypothetical protein
MKSASLWSFIERFVMPKGPNNKEKIFTGLQIVGGGDNL